MVEAAGEFGMKKLTNLAFKIHGTGEVPETLKENSFFVIPK